MFLSSGSRLTVFLFCACLAADSLPGCGQQRQRPDAVVLVATDAEKQEKAEPEAPEFSIEPYLQASRLGRWVYSRTVPGGSEAASYVRVVEAARAMEGQLVGREFLPLRDYVKPRDDAADRRDGRQRPQAPLEGGTAFMFELAEPLEVVPQRLVPDVALTATTEVIYYENDGRLLSRGTLTRTVRIEEFEEVEVPAGRFADCMRVRLDFRLQIPWLITLDWTSRLWFSPEVGEVRRTERMSGWVLILPFSSSHEYRLTSGGPSEISADLESLQSPRWRYGAVLMERTMPTPRIGGLVVDYSDLPASPPPDVPVSEDLPPSSAPAPVPEPALTSGSNDVAGGL